MHSAGLIASLLSLAVLASAQGAGRFPCDVANGATACDNLVPTGPETGGDLLKSDGFTPVGAECVAAQSGATFCGYVGAACNPNNVGAASACDNGLCVVTDIDVDPTVGTCTGDFGTPCGGDDGLCLGYLYCTSEDTTATISNTCGGIDSYCQDINLGGGATAAENQPFYSATCATGYCSAGTANCANRVGAGGDCTEDPEFSCDDGLTCDATFTCRLAPSGRARARRNEQLSKRSVCPSSHSACAVPGSRSGFECIDTESNLEQCGACSSNGGVDCTAIEGVDAVGCVGGQCEIWACASGFSFDHSSAACVVALVA